MLKKFIRKHKNIKNFLNKINTKFISVLISISPILASKYVYTKATGKRLNLKSPKDFNEKLNWLKIYWQNPLVSLCSDKFMVRKYISNCNCNEILNQLYNVYNSTDEIVWDDLPLKFVLKTNNGCGTNIICNDKFSLNEKKTICKLKKWLKIDYSNFAAELHYKKILPKIICEKYLETDAGFLPNDYKIYCFNGVPKIILVATERETKLKLNFMDLSWKNLKIASAEYNNSHIPKKPNSLGKMIAYSEKLSKPFPFVRVDFYEVDGKPIFGEMTFTPAGCSATYYNKYGLDLLGSMLKLPNKIL